MYRTMIAFALHLSLIACAVSAEVCNEWKTALVVPNPPSYFSEKTAFERYTFRSDDEVVTAGKTSAKSVLQPRKQFRTGDKVQYCVDPKTPDTIWVKAKSVKEQKFTVLRKFKSK